MDDSDIKCFPKPTYSLLQIKVLKHSSFFFFLYLFFFFTSCENDLKTVNEITAKGTGNGEWAEQVEMLYSESAKVLVKLNAPILNRVTTKESIFLEFPKGVHVEFYDSLLTVDSWLKAKWATYNEREQTMEARNDVQVMNKKGETLNTEHLIWNEKLEKIYSDAYVKITTAENIIFGEGFESDQYFEKYIIKKPKGIINIKDDAKNDSIAQLDSLNHE